MYDQFIRLTLIIFCMSGLLVMISDFHAESRCFGFKQTSSFSRNSTQMFKQFWFYHAIQKGHNSLI